MLEMSDQERSFCRFVEVAVSVILWWYNLMIINSKYNTEKGIGCTSLMQSIFVNTHTFSYSSNVWRTERKEQLLSLSRLVSASCPSVLLNLLSVKKDMDGWGNDGCFLSLWMVPCKFVMVVAYTWFALEKWGAIVHKTRSCHTSVTFGSHLERGGTWVAGVKRMVGIINGEWGW